MPRPLDLLKSTSCLPTSFFSLHDGRIAADLPHAGSSAALHQQGSSWAEIGERVGQRSNVVTADRTGLPERVRQAPTQLHAHESRNGGFAGAF
jgi:hypothetical protein